MLKWGLILLTVCASSSGDILCATGMSRGGELNYSGPSAFTRALRYILTRRLVILGVLCYATAFFSLLGLLSVAQLSVAVPATALSFVVDTLGARFILHEHVPWKRWIGVLCVSAGVVLAVKSGPPPPPHALARSPGVNRAPLQTCDDQARYHQPRAHDLHQQSASCEILAKP
jgi:multidrug transporter EmrE-like cation transporter